MSTKLVGVILLAGLCASPISVHSQTTQDAAKAKNSVPQKPAVQKTAEPDSKTAKPSTKFGSKPTASPGWVVIEETWWEPFQLESTDHLHMARVHFRQGEEKEAAAAIEKSVGWLKFAAAHGSKESAVQLQKSVEQLQKIATDLRESKILEAAQLDYAIGRAAEAVTKFHTSKAEEALANNDLEKAGKEIMSATHHIEVALNSASLEHSNDMEKLTDEVNTWRVKADQAGVKETEAVREDLEVLQRELKLLGQKLESMIPQQK